MDFSALIASYRPPSAVEEDVLESLQVRADRSKQPVRHLADLIIFCKPLDYIRQHIEGQELIFRLDERLRKGLRPLHHAAFLNQGETLSMLLELGADPNVQDDLGHTPVHVCAERGFPHLIDLLISFGARIRFTEITGDDESFGEPPRATAADEPLRLAIRNCEHETARFLLEHGANPSAVYYLGEEINLVDPTDLPSLDLLLNFGADPNARDLQGHTPLMKACRTAQAVEAVHLLISYGADVNALTAEDHKTSLHYAVLTGNLEIAELLVRNGASVHFPLERTRPPPLYYAVLRGNVEMAEFLLDSGADVNASSVVVGSALHLALTEKVPNQLEIVQVLLGRGANPNAVATTERGVVLKTPIGEYLQNCEHPRLDLVKLLLRYGAQVIFQVQRTHDLGILKVIHRIHLGLNPEVMLLLTEAGESFDVSFIRQSRQLSDDHKQLLYVRALAPFSLLQAARVQLRRNLGWGPRFLKGVSTLGLPRHLERYVLFEE